MNTKNESTGNKNRHGLAGSVKLVTTLILTTVLIILTVLFITHLANKSAVG